MPEKGTSTLRKRVCRQCGIEFTGGPRAWYCPACRMERQKEQARRCRQRTLKGQTRRIGSIDKCEVCGKDYIVNSARQRYCPDCAPERIREVDREQSRGWLKRAVDKHGEEYFQDVLRRKRESWHRKNAREIICPMCGSLFVPNSTNKKTCSDKCRSAALRYSYSRYAYKAGRVKIAPNITDYQKGGRLYDKKEELL